MPVILVHSRVRYDYNEIVDANKLVSPFACISSQQTVQTLRSCLAHQLNDSEKGFLDHIRSCGELDESLAAKSQKTPKAINLRKRKEASRTELRQYAKQFAAAKKAEYESWIDNDVFDLVDARKISC